MSCLGLSSTRRIVAHRSHCSSCCCGHHCGCCWVVWAVVAIVAVFAVDVTGHCNPCCGCCGEWIVVAVVQLVWVVENVPASCASWNCAVDDDSSSCDWYCSTMVSDQWHKKKCRLGNQTFSVMFCYSTLYNTCLSFDIDISFQTALLQSAIYGLSLGPFLFLSTQFPFTCNRPRYVSYDCTNTPTTHISGAREYYGYQ